MPIGSAINGVAEIANTLINQAFTEKNRKQNFYWNEKAADAADQRQRNQYHDLYSPQAMMNQYAAAGLSPSMMMSGGAPAVGSSSAQGNMSGGLQGPYPDGKIFDPIAAAQISNIWADTEGKKINNAIKDLEKKLKERSFILEQGEQQLLASYLYNQETKETESLMTAASRFKTYEEFINYVKKDVNIENNSYTKDYIISQAGQKTMQDIFKSAHNIDKEVAKIEGDKEYANIMLDVYTKLGNEDFASLSAQERISELRKIVQRNNLEADKKETINNIFNGIENENLRSFLMIMYMLGDRYLGSVNAGFSTNRGINKNTIIQQ